MKNLLLVFLMIMVIDTHGLENNYHKNTIDTYFNVIGPKYDMAIYELNQLKRKLSEEIKDFKLSSTYNLVKNELDEMVDELFDLNENFVELVQKDNQIKHLISISRRVFDQCINGIEARHSNIKDILEISMEFQKTCGEFKLLTKQAKDLKKENMRSEFEKNLLKLKEKYSQEQELKFNQQLNLKNSI